MTNCWLSVKLSLTLGSLVSYSTTGVAFSSCLALSVNFAVERLQSVFGIVPKCLTIWELFQKACFISHGVDRCKQTLSSSEFRSLKTESPEFNDEGLGILC